jgi:EAL domain-containing protein (putative c-di-GMP-specific phosphodiesterase class I)
MTQTRPEITRADLYRRLNQEADRSIRNGNAYALLQVQLAEGSGDGAIKPLETTLRSYDFIGRIGPGAYVAILSDVRGGHDALSALVDRIQSSLPSARIGIAIGGASAHAVASGAASACAASATRGSPTFDDPEIDQAMRRRREFHASLRSAVADGAIEVHYQPLYDADGSVPVGVEALARWSHGGRPVPPPDFIGHAERTGLIHALGEHVLRTACVDGMRWDGITVAVNVSPVQLRNPAFPATVESILSETGFPAERLELEVTESILASEPEAISARLAKLRAMGVRVALDDFGTGFSSLGYLRTLPFDRIKIDRSFVNDPGYQSQAIIEAVLGLGRSLGMSVTAEGIETDAQRDYLTQRGCGRFQGYLLGRPSPVETIDALMDAVPATPAGPR